MNKFLLGTVLAGATAAHAQSFLLQYYTNDGIPIETDATGTYSVPGGLSTLPNLAEAGLLLTRHPSSALTTISAVADLVTVLPDQVPGSTPK